MNLQQDALMGKEQLVLLATLSPGADFVIVSPLTGVIPLINGLFMAYK